jgi:hypothetical protein
MSTQVQFRRGTTAQTASFTGVTAEITVDTTKNTVVVHDGSTAGGFALARESALTANSFSVTAAFNTANAAFASANISNGIDATQNNTITAAFLAANAATATDTTQNNSITAAFTRANNSINANTGGTISANLVIAGANLVVANGATEIFNVRSWSTSGLPSTSNSTGTVTITGGVGVKGSIYADAVYDGGIEIIAYANSIFLAANTPSHVANSAAIYANGAFAAANAATATDATQNNSITAAFLAANAATATDTTQNNSITAAFASANAAFTRANNSLNANTGGSITGDISITGNLTVTGNTTYTNTKTVLIADNIITVNAAISQSAQPAVNAGIEVDRGAQPNSSFLWIESSGKWAANNGNASIFIASDSAESYANAAFAAANAATATDTTQNNSITAAFTRANNSLNANTGGTIAGQIAVDGGTYGNVTITPFASVYGQAYGANPYSIMQVRSSDFASGMGMQVYTGLNGLLYSNTGIQFNTSTIVRDKDFPTGGTSAGQFAANGAFIAQASLASTSNATGSIQVVGGVGVKGNVSANGIIFDDGTRQTTAADPGSALAFAIALG